MQIFVVDACLSDPLKSGREIKKIKREKERERLEEIKREKRREERKSERKRSRKESSKNSKDCIRSKESKKT